MKKQIKIFGIFFASVMAVSCVAGCGTKTPTGGGNEPPKFEETGYKLIEDGVSEYVIVLPAVPKSNDYLAADELNYFLNAATGTQLPVLLEGSYEINDT